MKKVFLVIMAILFFFNARAQNLNGSIWLGTKPPSPNLWFKFENDTVYYTMTGSGYTALSVFASSGSQFMIRDLAGTTACTDTGFYTFSVAGGILHFNLITDNCTSRKNTLVNYTWTMQSATGIAEHNQEAKAIVYPNPAYNGHCTLSLLTEPKAACNLNVYNVQGQLIESRLINSKETELNFSDLRSGVYTLIYSHETATNYIRLVR